MVHSVDHLIPSPHQFCLRFSRRAVLRCQHDIQHRCSIGANDWAAFERVSIMADWHVGTSRIDPRSIKSRAFSTTRTRM